MEQLFVFIPLDVMIADEKATFVDDDLGGKFTEYPLISDVKDVFVVLPEPEIQEPRKKRKRITAFWRQKQAPEAMEPTKPIEIVIDENFIMFFILLD